MEFPYAGQYGRIRTGVGEYDKMKIIPCVSDLWSGMQGAFQGMRA
jgi:hypothetical protein